MIRIFDQLWFGFRSRRKIWTHCSLRASAITRCHLRRGTSEPRHSRTPRRWARFPGKQNSDRYRLAQDWKVQSRNRDDRFDASVSFLSNFKFQKIYFSTHVFKLRGKFLYWLSNYFNSKIKHLEYSPLLQGVTKIREKRSYPEP